MRWAASHFNIYKPNSLVSVNGPLVLSLSRVPWLSLKSHQKEKEHEQQPWEPQSPSHRSEMCWPGHSRQLYWGSMCCHTQMLTGKTLTCPSHNKAHLHLPKLVKFIVKWECPSHDCWRWSTCFVWHCVFVCVCVEDSRSKLTLYS